MENAADALKMAAAMLAFLLALGVSISSFSKARLTADTLLKYADRETVTLFAEDTNNKTRLVGKETVVPAIYRAYKENYRIQFYESDGSPISLYKKNDQGAMVDVNYIDLEKETLGSDRQKENFIMALLYGAKGTFEDTNGVKIGWTEYNQELNKNNSNYKLENERYL